MEAVKKFLFQLVSWVIAVAVIGVAGWFWVSLKFVYSTGQRAGYVQKLSRKGWLIKTWEGDLAMVNLPGAMTEHFLFTVRRDDIARKIENSMGRRVVLTYQQHRFLPGQLLGETEYFIVNCQVQDDQQPSSTPQPSASPASSGTI